MAKTVPMVRTVEGPAPHRADVHPDEVANYAAGGWEVAEAATEGLTDAEINADLEAMGVEFDPRAKKANRKLRDGARAKRDAAQT